MRDIPPVPDHDIELESDEFNRAFTVTCPDRKFASDVLTPQTMQLLLAHPDLGWWFENGHLLTARPGAGRPETIEGTLATLAAILTGIPAFVWADHTGGAAPR